MVAFWPGSSHLLALRELDLSRWVSSRNAAEGVSSMAKQWRCAVIGTSMVGQTHVKVLSQMENVKLVALCDLNPDRAKAAMEKHGVTGVPIYKDQAEMHDKEQLDVVNIATPSGMHKL